MNIPKRILLAEDNINDIELTIEAFREHRIANEIDCVRDGVETLDYLHRRNQYSTRSGSNPAVILLDIKMPKIDGITVLKEIKNDVNLKTIPVVMLTSSREEKDLVQSYNFGVNAYVVKPVRFDDFINAVKQIGVFWVLINETPIL